MIIDDIEVPDELIAKCHNYLDNLNLTLWASHFWLTTSDHKREAAEWFAFQITRMEKLCPDPTPEATKVAPNPALSFANSTDTAQLTATTPATNQPIPSSPSKTLTSLEMTT